MFPGMPDLGQILQQAQQMQAEVTRAQESLAHTQISGHAGGGLVSAVVSGDGNLISLDIDPSVVDPTDIETLADLIVAAVRDANRAAAELSASTMNSATGGLASGFDLGALGFGGALEPDDDETDADDDDDDDDETDDDDDDDDETDDDETDADDDDDDDDDDDETDDDHETDDDATDSDEDGIDTRAVEAASSIAPPAADHPSDKG